MWFRTQKKGAIFRPAVVLLSVATIAFPPNVFADAITFTYNGGGTEVSPTNYSDPSAWTCAPSCGAGAFPDNATAGGSVDAVINSGQPDYVLLDTPSVITSLNLGGVSPTSALTTNGPSLTLGTPSDYRENVLAINSGGTLNINNATVTLELSGQGGFFNGSGALIDSGGVIQASGGTLKLQNSSGDNNGRYVTNNGSINLDATSSLQLDDSGLTQDFHFAGSGALNLAGAQIVGTAGTEGLFNEGDHTIAGNGSIGVSYFNNSGTLRASGGTLTASNLANLSSTDLSSGTYVVDNGATLQLSGYDGSNYLSYIDQGASVTVNVNGLLTTDGTTNALLGVSGVAGNLTLQNGASLTADSGQITGFTSYGGVNGGTVSVLSGSSLDLSPVTFYNAEGGNLTGGFAIGTGSTITYAGDDINSIDASGSLTLGGDGHFTNHDLQTTLSTVGGAFALNDGAAFTSATATFGADDSSGPGYVSVLNGSTLDLTGTQWQNEVSGVLQNGDFEIGKDSTLKYTGNDISTIDETASLTLDSNGALVNTADAPNADPLTKTLTTVNGNLSLDQGASLTPNAGTFTVGSFGSVTLDHGSTLDLENVTLTNESGGVLTQGFFAVGDASTLTYKGNDLTTIGTDAALGLAGSWAIVNTTGGNHDAVSNTLATVNGALILDQGASLTLTQQFTNNGLVGLAGGSSLTAGSDSSPVNFTNNWDGTNVDECGCSQGALFGLQNSSATISGNLNNTSNTFTQFAEFSAQVALEEQSSLTVNGSFTNDSSNGAGYSALTLDDGSTATVKGLFSNLGGSLVDLDFLSSEGEGSGGSTLNANGGFVNSNSAVYLENGSTLNVQLPGDVTPGPGVWAFKNLSDDVTGDWNQALLQVGGARERNAPSVVNISGGLLNLAKTTAFGQPTSTVNVEGGSVLNADTILNLSKATMSDSSPEAEINVLNGSALNVTGAFRNVVNANGGDAYADVYVGGNSTLTADSVENKFISSNDGTGAATITIDESTMNVNKTFNNTGGVLNLTNAATVNVGGQFTNDAHGVVSLDAQQAFSESSGAYDQYAGSVLNTNGFSNSGQVSLNQSSTLNNTGDFDNSGTITVDNHSALNIKAAQQDQQNGSTLLSAAQPVLTNTGSIATGTNGDGGNTVRVEGSMFNTAPGVVNVHGEDDNMTVTGQFSNSGSVSIGDGATIQAGSYTQSAGTTDIGQGGTLQANVEVAGGTVSGGGTIVGDVTVDGGTLAPGDPQSIDIIGDYHQTLAGILDIDIAGAGDGEYDQVNVMSDEQHPDGGDVWLGGTLDLTLEAGFGAGIDIGTLFHILTWTGERLYSSDFDFFHNLTFSNGTQLLKFQEVFGDHGLDLEVIDAGVATPEPSTLAMLFGAMLLAGGAVRMRRRRNGLT